MEVHHHSHLASGKTQIERKKFTHYLWEFLMLFLAVFCGFLAENFREHQVEKTREKQYMQSLIADLSADAVRLSRGIKAKEDRVNAIDSVFIFFNTHHDARTISGRLFR